MKILFLIPQTMKTRTVEDATMQICLVHGVKRIAVLNIGGVVTEEQRGVIDD